MYISFSEYSDMGGAVSEAAFPRLEFLAEQKIDRYTQSRVKAMDTVPETVKYCMVDLVDAPSKIDLAETAVSAALASFTNDGYSETYAEPATAQTQENGLYAIIVNWLAATKNDNGVPLLYLGVDA